MASVLASKSALAGLTALPSRPVSRRSALVVRAEAKAAKKERAPSPLERGGTLSGEQAAGKDASAATKAAMEGTVGGTRLALIDGRFVDDRWIEGTWDFSQFKGADGETDWDAVIDAEIARRRMLESTPIASVNDDPVNFDTDMVPWWAWVRRFHLPEAEKVNGRAAMVGYFMALVVDSLSGAGLLDQQGSFFGKLLLNVTVIGCLFIRNTDDIKKFQGLFDEATFYDRQWNASWEGVTRPSEKTSE